MNAPESEISRLRLTMTRIGLLAVLALQLFQPAWAQPVSVLIAYDSVDGHTEQLAGWIATGAREDPEAEVRLLRVDKVSQGDLLWADAILVGSPVYNAGPTPAVAEFLAELPFEGNPLKNKAGASFASAKGASAGEELVMLDILHCMLVLQMVTFGGDDWRSGFGVSYILDATRDPQVLEFTRDKALRLGRRAVQVARATEPLRAPGP
jgi:NAD(P)H dehydrogenase (quinone)